MELSIPAIAGGVPTAPDGRSSPAIADNVCRSALVLTGRSSAPNLPPQSQIWQRPARRWPTSRQQFEGWRRFGWGNRGFDRRRRGCQEGVLYAKKDFNLEKHPDIDVPNLQVIKPMQSFKSKEYVRETFAWMYYYWYLTDDGIEFFRTFLNLLSEIVPATLKKSAKAPSRPFGTGPPGDRPRVHHALMVTDRGLGTRRGTVQAHVKVVLEVTRVVLLLTIIQALGWIY